MAFEYAEPKGALFNQHLHLLDGVFVKHHLLSEILMRRLAIDLFKKTGEIKF